VMMRTAPCWMLKSPGEDAVDTEPELVATLDVGAEGCREDRVSHLPSSSGINTHNPYLTHQLSTKDAQQSSEGYPMKVD